MPYYSMAYHMPNLEPPLRPPTALSGLTDLLNTVTGGIANVFGAADTAIASTLSAAQRASYCSVANPQGSCKPIAGVCVPMNSVALESFKNLQRQANRMAAKEGRPLIGVDGRIGNGTVAQVTAALRYTDSTWATKTGGCDLVAANANSIANTIQAAANMTNTPTPPDPPTSKPSIPVAGGGVAHPPENVIVQSASGGGLFNWIPAEVKTPIGLAALAFGGFAIWKATKGGKKGGRKKATKRKGRARRVTRRRRGR